MAGPSKLGAHKARPETWSVTKKDTGTVQFDIQVKLLERKTGGVWEPVDNEERVTGYLNLIQKNGNVNQINYEMVKTALKWDGLSLAALHETDWTKVDVQVWIAEEAGNDGKMYPKLKYLNPIDYAGPSGGIDRSDSSVVQSLDAKYGAMLRAMSSNTGNGAHATTTKLPAAAADPNSTGKGLAWSAYTKKIDEFAHDNPDAPAWDQEKRAGVFKHLFGVSFPGRDGKSLTAQDWAKFKKVIEDDFSVATEDLVPF